MASDFEAAVMRKVAWRLVPFLSIGYLINALDRFNVSIAALTMNKALGLSATAYGLGAGAFFWSYVLCQVPANLIMGKVGARTWLTAIMAVWALASAATALVTGEHSFVAARFLLGIAEAGFFPGVAYFMTCWFPARYRGRMMGIFFAAGAVSGVIGAPISANLLQLDGWFGIQGWQWVFLLEGAPGLILALFGYALLRNRPADAGWLSPDERAWLQDRLDREAAVKSTHGSGLLPALLNPQIIVLTVAFTLILYAVYATIFFVPLIIKGFGLSNLAVGYVSVLPNLCGAVGMVLVSRSSDRTGERIWHVVGPVAIAGIGLVAAAFSLGNGWLAVAALCLTAFGLSSTLPVFWNLPTAYFGAATAAAGLAAINTVGNLSGYIAPQLMGVLHDATGGYAVPLLVAGIVALTAAGLILASGIRQHVRRAALAAEAVSFHGPGADMRDPGAGESFMEPGRDRRRTTQRALDAPLIAVHPIRRQPQWPAVTGDLSSRLQPVAQAPTAECAYLGVGRHRLDRSLKFRALFVDRGDDRPHRHAHVDQHRFRQLQTGLDGFRVGVRDTRPIQVRGVGGITRTGHDQQIRAFRSGTGDQGVSRRRVIQRHDQRTCGIEVRAPQQLDLGHV
ncbi:MAG TPA: MFS transporter, partial [Rhodopila sp.]